MEESSFDKILKFLIKYGLYALGIAAAYIVSEFEKIPKPAIFQLLGYMIFLCLIFWRLHSGFENRSRINTLQDEDDAQNKKRNNEVLILVYKLLLVVVLLSGIYYFIFGI